MDRFHPIDDKKKPLTEVVSFHGVVPLERGLCYVIYLVSKHDRRFDDPKLILSAARDEWYIVEHNRQFGTNLHSQPWLIAKHEQDPEHYAAADSVNQTSHCLFSDGNPVYVLKNDYGTSARSGREIPWFQRGVDWFNNGVAAEFAESAAKVGIDVELPYKSGSEQHHAVLRHSPTKVLVDHNVIKGR